MKRLATDYDLILSDSSTCTSDEIPNTKDQFWQDRNGSEFDEILSKECRTTKLFLRQVETEFLPM